MGFSSGMFGIGGSVVATPLLTIMAGMSAMLALATPLPAAMPSAVSGSVRYAKAGLIKYNIALPAVLSAIPFGFLGAYLNNFTNDSLPLILKSVFLMLLGLKFFFASKLFKKQSGNSNQNIKAGIISGILTGLVSGYIAVGGGIVLVTAFIRINKLTMKEAVATSLFCVGILALTNSIAHYGMGNIDIATTLILAVTVIPFSSLGARAAIKLKNSTLEKAFGIFLIIFASYFIYTISR